MKKRNLLIANWKSCIQDLATVKNRIQEINELLSEAKGVVICPPFPYLQALVNGIKNPDIAIGSQNISTSELNASTGEVLASMQKDMGCGYSIVGHSEVRERYQESNDTVAIKASVAMKHEMIPIICIGETEQMRNNGDYLKFLINQLIESLPQTENPSSANIIIAYEPIWAIGTGATPSASQIEEVITTLRLIPGLEKHQFLYGGSVNETNIRDIKNIKNVDGFLVGAASTDIHKLAKIYQTINSCTA